MRLLPILPAVALAALALPGVALAHNAMCNEPLASEAPARDVPTPKAELVDVPTALAPIVLRVVADARSDDAPLPYDDVPWCVSPDDPRCNPLPGDSPQTQAHREAPVPALTLRLPKPVAADPNHSRTPAMGLGPRAGHTQPVERPPRADRR